MHTLIHVAAQRLATKHWRLLGARSQGEVHGFYVAQLRRRMGVTAVREFARHRLRRAAYVDVPRAVVEQILGSSSHVYLVLEEVTSGSEWGVLLWSPTHSNASSPMHDGKFLFKNM